MPWSNQNGGGGGGWKGGGGPWGQGPSGGPNQPDLEELLKRSQDKLRRVMPGSGLPGPLLLLVVAAAIAFGAFMAFTVKVGPDEQGIVLRFGKYDRWYGPGLHFRLPYPVEEVMLPKVTRTNQVEIGMRALGRGGTAGGVQEIPLESLMLTGDENIVDIHFVVFWVIKDAPSYLFNLENPRVSVKVVAESAMREIIGKSDIQPILTGARQKTEAAVLALMQKTLDGYKAGIEITQVNMQKVDPPKEVIDAFRDVQVARADQERLKNEATAYANKIVPEARGEAERIRQRALGYKEKSIADATGQANRFLAVFKQYKLAPDVTRKRMFLETMEQVFGDMDKIIIDSKGGAPGVVPYLPLDQLTKTRPQAK